jgi:formylglycine-generating enzyme required for sulfatase activity
VQAAAQNFIRIVQSIRTQTGIVAHQRTVGFFTPVMVKNQTPPESNSSTPSAPAAGSKNADGPASKAPQSRLLRRRILWTLASASGLALVFTALKISTQRPAEDSAAPEMVSFPGNKFHAGNDKGDADEKPVHEVELSPYAIDRLEVTVQDYLACVDTGACGLPGRHNPWCNREREEGLQHPMNCLTHAQASAYCAWKGKRLPTETEWEHAAKGAESRTFPWGEAPPKEQACYDRGRNEKGSCKVGSFPTDKTPEGVLDMGGNVAEWTSTDYCLYDGTGCKQSTAVTRGGSWDMENPNYARTTFRDFVPKYERGYNLGFRCARPL